ncbi:P-type conjugative transfer protein VirB9 [Xanthomonas fragariae]|uniref:P-type conjugative transfer protein VirB9 n=1 Tax=Xanthomonas fragariae TaxID=48664 RepID=UPI000D55E63D|nr:P-type conjugative transfer protein VirB9 [Xanthomonas fragariae]MEA5249899.1 P-type conjugative transfer protein VirB9 [Xanthomonas fragariae]
MKRLSLALAAMLIVSPASAVDVPSSSRFDNRIQYVNYNVGDVVLVRALPGLAVRIVFAPDERIVAVGTGFSQGWEFRKSNNILMLKPKSVKAGGNGSETEVMAPEAGKWNTNLMVTTDKRLYDFDLQLLPGSNEGAPARDQRVAYRVEFRYPGEVRAKQADEARKRVAEQRLSVKPSPVNWNYSMQIGEASEAIAPALAYDDGRFTYLRFPNNRDFPTAFLVAGDKSESIVNSHVDPSAPDILVLHRVAREMVLRLGTAVVGVYNDSYNMDGVPTSTGTTVPGVQRVIKSSEVK